MADLHEFLGATARPARAGLHRIGGRPGLGEIVVAAHRSGWRVTVVDGRRVSTKAALLDELAGALGFPTWFGHNWDALADCLRDTAAAAATDGGRGTCVVWDGAEVLAARDPDARDTFASICDELGDDGVPLVVLARSGRPSRGSRPARPGA